MIREIAISPRSGAFFGASFLPPFSDCPLRSLKLRRMHGHSKDHLLPMLPAVKVNQSGQYHIIFKIFCVFFILQSTIAFTLFTQI